MFLKTKAFTSFAVKDLATAKDFYEDTLDMKVTEEAMGILTLHIEGGYKVIIYPKPDYEPATFTVLNFPVEDLEQTVDELTNRGVAFERYNLANIETDAKGIARGKGHGPDIAWFKDPAGNILSVMEIVGK